MKYLLTVLLILVFATGTHAQSFLYKKVTVQVNNRPLSEVFRMAEKQAGFYFSYNSNILRSDSLVSITHTNKSVEQLLLQLFGSRFQYQESDNYIIIRPSSSQQVWYINGIVTDLMTGLPISNATIYEPYQLVSAMTDENGYFRLQLKEKKTDVHINISKISYSDTVIAVSSASSQNIKVEINPVSYSLDSIVIENGRVEDTWLGRMMLSSRQKMNSLNLSNFFAQQPFQFSLTPGLGSHGRMGSQVIDRFSFNLIGGYTAGIGGFEIGTVFNIVKKDMKYVQVGGVFNIVGGKAEGIQVGGLYNQVLENMNGVQVGGLANRVQKQVIGLQAGGLGNIVQAEVSGMQIGGLYNQAKRVHGVQVGGLANIDSGGLSGMQIAGLYNHAREVTGMQISGLVSNSVKTMRGVQISGLVNYARHLKGLQIGLINIADTSEGYSFGLINIVKKGYHKLSVFSSDLHPVNLAFRAGSYHFYSILTAGTGIDNNRKSFSAGYGLGSEINISDKITVNPELTGHWVYTGDTSSSNSIVRAQLNLQYKLTPVISIYLGPSFSVMHDDRLMRKAGYKSDFVNGAPSVIFSEKISGWIGWNIGLSFF